MNDLSTLFICYYIIIIFSIWFGHTKLQTSLFHGVKKINSNNSSYCCKSCPENPIFFKKILKKKFQKKNFHQKKSKNQNWSIFDFSLIGRSVFELEAKTGKLRKQVELGQRIVSTCLRGGWDVALLTATEQLSGSRSSSFF